MSASPESATPASDLVLRLGENPVAVLEAAVWAMAAIVSVQRQALSEPLADVLLRDPQRTAVLESVGLVRRGPDGYVVHPSLGQVDVATAHSAVEAKLSSLRQAVSAAASDAVGTPEGGWGAQSDEVLLSQGRASAATGRALAGKVVPRLAGCAERLAAEGSRVLDVGTGVGALALALAESLPRVRVEGIDVLERALALGRAELAAADPAVAARVSLRHKDVVDVSEKEAYQLVWLPAPFLSQEALRAALPRLAEALAPGAWLVAGTNPVAEDALLRSVGRWTAVRGGGNSFDTARMTEEFEALGLVETNTFPTVPGGPVLVAARRPQR
ncbi:MULTISPECIES: class I SAM-dependent methyltransferase [Streptomyces]|uniref:class I SAM-dependent methyltransferase n=1 Tax=Streptomyces TaxID=1883 RepID=UPI0023DD1E70|nr:class I SAM-dependent methyltransferase [Streptomyces sp. FXJ1.172]WEP00956.1 class I SAM-dependent methyltransferase [Streptomyces sp. FXJ1.172]